MRRWLTLAEARLIAQLRTIGCTYRAIASTFYPPADERHGIQSEGEFLVQQAIDALGLDEQLDLDDFDRHTPNNKKIKGYDNE